MSDLRSSCCGGAATACDEFAPAVCASAADFDGSAQLYATCYLYHTYFDDDVSEDDCPDDFDWIASYGGWGCESYALTEEECLTDLGGVVYDGGEFLCRHLDGNSRSLSVARAGRSTNQRATSSVRDPSFNQSSATPKPPVRFAPDLCYDPPHSRNV